MDAACYLRVEFADTSIVAFYGRGERPAPECQVPRAVSDVAFALDPGQIVQIVVSSCGSEGHFVRRLGRREE